MTVLNRSITILGATAKVTSFTVYPQLDGTYVVTAVGTATDGASFTEQLTVTQSFGSGVAVLNNMSAAALLALQQANGLST
jgi:hypothetical protein